MFLSGLLAGPFADARGRCSIILLGLTSNSVVGVLSSCVSTASQLVVLRFVTGLGLGMVIGGVVALAAELSPPGSRGRSPAVTDLMVKDASFYFLLYIKFDLIKSFKEVRTKKSQN